MAGRRSLTTPLSGPRRKRPNRRLERSARAIHQPPRRRIVRTSPVTNSEKSPERAGTYVAFISPPPESMLSPLHGRLTRSSRKGDHHGPGLHDPSRSAPLPRRGSARGPGRPSPTHSGDTLAQQGARRRSVAGRAVGDAAGARALLGDRLRLAQVRGETERATAIQDRDR